MTTRNHAADCRQRVFDSAETHAHASEYTCGQMEEILPDDEVQADVVASATELEEQSRDSDELMQQNEEQASKAIVEATKIQLKAGKARISWLESLVHEAQERARQAEEERDFLEDRVVQLEESLQESRSACRQLALELKQSEGKRFLLLYIIAMVAKNQSARFVRRSILFDALEQMHTKPRRVMRHVLHPREVVDTSRKYVGGPLRMLANPSTMLPRSRFTTHVHVRQYVSFLPFG